MPRPKKIVGSSKAPDENLLRFYSQCFDRPAFRDRFVREGSIEDFNKAIEDTIVAINTGTHLKRDGTLLAKAKGKSFLIDVSFRATMDFVVDLLQAIRSRYKLAIDRGEIDVWHTPQGMDQYCVYNNDLPEWFDRMRDDALKLVNELLVKSNLPVLRLPHQIPRYDEI